MTLWGKGKKMTINERLYQLFLAKAESVNVDRLSIGLGYTAVRTSDGGCGLAYTYLEQKLGCSVRKDDFDFESKPAALLLEKIKSPDPLEKSTALALVNALNYRDAATLPEDPRNAVLFDHFRIEAGTRVSMVGFFGPLIKVLKDKGAVLEIIDENRRMGKADDFKRQLSDWTDVLILTSTSILNDSADAILDCLGPRARTVILGPSTPMVAAAFRDLPVHMLAGSVPVDFEAVFKGIRFAMGTPVLLRSCRKKYLTLP